MGNNPNCWQSSSRPQLDPKSLLIEGSLSLTKLPPPDCVIHLIRSEYSFFFLKDFFSSNLLKGYLWRQSFTVSLLLSFFFLSWEWDWTIDPLIRLCLMWIRNRSTGGSHSKVRLPFSNPAGCLLQTNYGRKRIEKKRKRLTALLSNCYSNTNTFASI